MRVLTAAFVAIVFGAVSGSFYAQKIELPSGPPVDNKPTDDISEVDWNSVSDSARADTRYATSYALRREAVEPELERWQAEWGVFLKTEWKAYPPKEAMSFFGTADDKKVLWRIEQEYVLQGGVRDYFWSASKQADPGRKDRPAPVRFKIPDDRMKELTFDYLEAVWQASPLDRPAPELNVAQRTAASIISELCSKIDADYVLPEESVTLTVRLRDRTYREIIELVAESAGWNVQVTSGLQRSQANFDELPSRLKPAKSEADLNTEPLERLRQLLAGAVSKIQPGDVRVTAVAK